MRTPGVPAGPAEHDDPTPGTRRLALMLGRVLVVVLSLMVTGVIANVALVHSQRPTRPVETGAMATVSPGGVVEPAQVPEAIAAHYRMAEEHSDVFASVPCYCGCEAMLGHRHLLDCFVRPDGVGWEAHAIGCSVCLGEAEQVGELLAAGVTDTGEIREAVADRWSDPYTPD